MNLRTSSPLSLPRGLAPMEGVTDFATRLWFQFIGGIDFTWTPFLRVTDTFPQRFPDLFAPELSILKGLFSAPLILQVMGSRPEDIVRTAELAGDRVEFIDLNCGCPSPTVVGSRAGSSLLENPHQFGEFIEKICNKLGPSRLSIKMRTGFHRSEEFPKLLNAIKSAPLRHLTIHGRTRPQRYTGAADWTKVHEATVNCPFPVIGSGDVCDIGTLKTRQACSPHIKAVIIGRGALRNPWVFTTASNAPVLASLAAFILLQDLALESHERLVSWCAELNSDAFGIDDEDGWQRLIENLMSDLRSKNIKTLADIEVTSRALSRGKMLWNYLRSSLPVAFMEPSLMRAQTLAGFLGQINEIARQLHISPANLPVVYNSEHDWMYSGAGRGPKP